jgi:hypothetical protein
MEEIIKKLELLKICNIIDNIPILGIIEIMLKTSKDDPSYMSGIQK